jgi:hypothetical protein
MVWQDVAISVASLVFSLSLLPQLWAGFREKKGPIKPQTSVPTFAGLFVVSYAYFTLSLIFSAAVCFLTGCIWLALFAQWMMYGRKIKKRDSKSAARTGKA